MRNDMPYIGPYRKFHILAEFLKEVNQFGIEMPNLSYESL
jgi:hypothetical protein